MGVKKEEDAKLGKQKVKRKKYKLLIPLHTDHPHQPFLKMKKKTKVMLSSPSNPKHKLRKCKVKSKREKNINDLRFFLLKN